MTESEFIIHKVNRSLRIMEWERVKSSIRAIINTYSSVELEDKKELVRVMFDFMNKIDTEFLL